MGTGCGAESGALAAGNTVSGVIGRAEHRRRVVGTRVGVARWQTARDRGTVRCVLLGCLSAGGMSAVEGSRHTLATVIVE